MTYSAAALRLMAAASIILPAILTPPPARAAETRTFTAPDDSYSFAYPPGFRIDREHADGTGDATGVTASAPANGDVVIAFRGPHDPGAIREVNERTRQAIADEFTKAVAVLPSIGLQSSSMTTMLGMPAVDMVFLNRRFASRPGGSAAVNRFILTVASDRAYVLACVYREDKAAEFSPACDLAASTARLAAAASPSPRSDGDAGATAAASCTRLEINRRIMRIAQLGGALMMKDQLPATIQRVRKANEAMMEIDTRAGASLSDQDCKDIDAIAATLN